MSSTFGFIFLILITISITTYAKNHSAVQKNRIRITDLYRQHILTRPLMTNLSQTTVAVGLGILEVAGIDPQKQVITLNVNFEFKWCDELLQWNISEQACVEENRSEIFFSAHEIWTPDITAINGPGPIKKESKLQYPISVVCTGLAQWSYQEKLVSFCEIDVLNFPFDRQYCSIQLQSTIYDSSQLKLRSLYNVVRLYNYINTEWNISHTTIKEINLYNANHKRNFSTLQIDMELVRFSRFYLLKFILPFCIISSLAVFSFCLPTDSGEKIALTLSILLSLIIYLQLISNYVPKTERGLCTLTLYSNVVFLLVFFSCIFNTLTIFIYYHEQYSYRQKIPKRKKHILTTVHKSLIELNKQRCLYLRKRHNIHENSPEYTNTDAIELLHDIQYFRQSLMNMFIRRNSIITPTTLSSFDFRHPLFYPRSQAKWSAKQISILIDRILFIIYLISMPLSILILFQSINRSRLASLARTNSTNQLLVIRKSTIAPVLLFCGCQF
ncbi:unnamed protein product [Rotaria sp. Silwood2]|nr:unnamed protein product [Rotaria sp. Silwood2]CAF2621801.1 unnamed protein product [Rotaria sp. Silwood2]CAF2860612.1 unnamed protein product [Rotaria sp. Silwood2]CAF3027515.1 unnamed protein product [Rotaria sp. Silwood2]CAF3912093.1 unnamed protein product [Rotaria sp. Silwood2]